MHILVADSNIQYRMQLSNKIIELGHTVIEALDEQNVLTICKNNCPDLLFIDAKLSGVSGLELIYKIRQLGGSSVWNTIVLLSAEPYSETDLKKGLDYGADDFFVKPMSDFQLLYKLSTASRHQNLKNDIFAMAHDLAISSRALENVNKQDVMTGLCDANVFYKSLEAEWFRSKKAQYNIVLILLNIDYFKAYNEIYGADVGDQKIKQVATALHNKLPIEYQPNIARTAGETFAILLPKQDLVFGLKIANDLIKVIFDLSIPHKGSACSNMLTISSGVAITHQKMKGFLDLLEAADFALYTAKHTGRNKAYAETKDP